MSLGSFMATHLDPPLGIRICERPPGADLQPESLFCQAMVATGEFGVMCLFRLLGLCSDSDFLGVLTLFPLISAFNLIMRNQVLLEATFNNIAFMSHSLVTAGFYTALCSTYSFPTPHVLCAPRGATRLCFNLCLTPGCCQVLASSC